MKMRNWGLIAGLAALVGLLAPAGARAEGESRGLAIQGITFGKPKTEFPYYHMAIQVQWDHAKPGTVMAARVNGVEIPKVPFSPFGLCQMVKDGKPARRFEKGGITELRFHYMWAAGEKVDLELEVNAGGDSKTNLLAKYSTTASSVDQPTPRPDWYNTKALFVSEHAGLDRSRELVDLPMAFEARVVHNPATDIQIFRLAPGDGKATPVPFQVYQTDGWQFKGPARMKPNYDDTVTCRLVFPADVSAYQTGLFAVCYGPPEDKRPTEPLVKNTGSDLVVTKDEGYGYTVSNSLYAAALSGRCGQISNIVIQGSQRALRGGGTGSRYHTWHWGPDVFLSEMRDTTNFTFRWPHAWEWNPAPSNATTEGPLFFELRRSGALSDVIDSRSSKTEGYRKDVDLELTYRFCAWAPYILVTSRFIFNEDCKVNCLRADSTMFPRGSDFYAWSEDGQTQIRPLEAAKLPYRTPWFGVYNSANGEGVASLLLNICNVGPNGQKAVERCPAVYMYKDHWMRAAIFDFWHRSMKGSGKNPLANGEVVFFMTPVPKGSEYVDEMAYLMFRYDGTRKCKEVEDWYTRLAVPLKVSYEQ